MLSLGADNRSLWVVRPSFGERTGFKSCFGGKVKSCEFIVLISSSYWQAIVAYTIPAPALHVSQTHYTDGRYMHATSLWSCFIPVLNFYVLTNIPRSAMFRSAPMRR